MVIANILVGQDLQFQNLLGSAVNILEKPNVFDVQSVLNHKKDEVIIKLAEKTKKVSIPGIAEKVTVRENVEIVSGGNGTTSTDIEVNSGSELSNSLKMERSVNGKYLAMTVEMGGGFSYESTVTKSSMYALMAINQTQFSTFLQTRHDQETASLSRDFLQAAQELPKWQETDAIKDIYQKFFYQWGTHVIRRCHYGCRFSLQVEAQNAQFENKTEFKANVKAEFGENFGSSASIENKNSYEEYLKKRSTIASVTGGDRSSSLKLQRDPASKDAFKDWADSINLVESSAVTGLGVESLGTLLNRCGVSKGNDMIDALKSLTKEGDPTPITVHGYLYSSVPKAKDVLYVTMWGEGFQSFEIKPLYHGYIRDPNPPKPPAKELVTNEMPALVDNTIPEEGFDCYRYAAHVTIHGITGMRFAVGLSQSSSYGSKGMHLRLFPPGGVIACDFTHEREWNAVEFPSLLAFGHYVSKD
ncbi:hypothetical protein N7447_000002 [Penicillium robsamsonii]|uniref:uncharacterized protein n=1 Tax=Penicillium robsamsonii TaxID=1792511 RepID=UPI002548C4EA|nr:uncharacterized protein N7447_000002 [Penicillium robsamsonii]KAJ5833976.1 hypothetical protein N7447_000002 [Penicillium robsamsonii]